MADAASQPAVRGVLRQPFDEQIAFFRGKLGRLLPTERWDQVWKAQHDRAFMVAGAMKADLLSDLAGAVDHALVEGRSLDAFRKDFDAIVERHGWAYRGERNWRTRTIYGTNLRTSYGAGRLAQLREGGFQFWVYRHGGSLDPRPQHLAWDGLVLPADHPFWQSHYPPNGWGCACRVVGVRSLEQARAVGGDPDKALAEGWNKSDPVTGEPEGIDRGWGYAPGDLAYQAQVAAGQMTRWSDAIARDTWLNWAQRLEVDTLDRLFHDLGSSLTPERRAGMVRAATERYVELVMAKKTVRGLDIAPARSVAAMPGDLRESWLSLDASYTRHTLLRLGTEAERARGQVPVVARDLSNLDRILDRATLQTLTRQGAARWSFASDWQGHHYEGLLERRRGRLVLVTLFKRPQKNP
jgi:hypothetical protein